MRIVLRIIAIACAASVHLTAQAVSLNPTMDDRVTIRGGPFFADINSSVRVRGQDFDLEDALDDSKTTGAIELDWRITSRLILSAGFSQVSRDETMTAGAPITGGGVTIPAGSSATAELTTRTFGAALGYSFVRNHTTEFGADLGVKVLTIEDRLSFTPAGGPTILLVDDDTTEPLPTIGLYFNHAFSRQWMISARLGYFDFDFGDIDGKITDGFGGIEFRPWQSVGFGAGYLYTDAELMLKGDVEATDVNYEYKGPFAYLVIGLGSVR